MLSNIFEKKYTEGLLKIRCELEKFPSPESFVCTSFLTVENFTGILF